ncbi:DNA glycosylase AlkZ-like family protein [Kitasatospora sp. NBC_01539]|uniref:DNA glycosylase AlkZ-like family protein n=1 Tax=Kitasatospora sp. NBC_01539 TaxID=2903577 RepID=UPI0038601F1F
MLDHESVRGLRARAPALADGVREASAEAVVRRVFAIQAQDAMAADLGIRVRGRNITAAGIRAAYEDDRSIVRGWFMRGTLHAIPSSDARWVLRLLAHVNFHGRYGFALPAEVEGGRLRSTRKPADATASL